MTSAPNSVTIVEVAPRDGFQSVQPIISTQEKIAIVDAAADAGAKRIEAGSFVSPSVLPQMADICEVLAGSTSRPDLMRSVLIPNVKGAQLALKAGISALVYVVSASKSHNAANVRRTVQQSMEDLRVVVEALPANGHLRLNVATAFHCPFEGQTPADPVLKIVEEALALRKLTEIGLCDTTGRATPAQVRTTFTECMKRFGREVSWAYHAHDTYGLGLASSWAAYEGGVRIFDAALAGLEGCPFAPGASGNIATEDLAYMFEATAITTGFNFEKLLTAANLTAQINGATIGGHLRNVKTRAPIS